MTVLCDLLIDQLSQMSVEVSPKSLGQVDRQTAPFEVLVPIGLKVGFFEARSQPRNCIDDRFQRIRPDRSRFNDRPVAFDNSKLARPLSP